MNNTIDNQQATPIELSYLAGLWDGEGTCTVVMGKSGTQVNYAPRSSIGNTSEVMINEVAKILDKIGISGKIYLEHRKVPNKNLMKIEIQSLSKNKIFLDAILPYIKVKKAQVELLLRFVNARLKRQEEKRQYLILNENGKIKESIRHDLYTKEEISFAEQIRFLNQKGKSPTTTRETLEKVSL